jgi:hypothetical protein
VLRNGERGLRQSKRPGEANAYLFDATGEKTMNGLYKLLFPASIVISLGLLGPGSWLRAEGRGEVVKLGKLKSPVPADWAREKPDELSGYRQYRLEAIGDDKEVARLTIDLLRKGGGDSAEKQVERWKAMFFPPQTEPDGVAKVRELKVGGAAVTYLDVRGDYKGIPGDQATPRANYRLLGVYFATPQGPYRIRVLGPADTVEFYRKGFENWVKAFE